jgi:hypothetical protein
MALPLLTYDSLIIIISTRLKVKCRLAQADNGKRGAGDMTIADAIGVEQRWKGLRAFLGKRKPDFTGRPDLTSQDPRFILTNES